MDSLDLNSLAELFEEISALLESTSNMSYSFTELLYAFMAIASLVVSAFGMLFSVLTTGVGIVILIVSTIVSALAWLAFYLLRAIPTFAIGRKMRCGCAWLAWIPIFQKLFCLFVLCKSSGKSNFEFANGKIKLNERIYSFLIYLALYFFGYTLITLLIGLLNLIPGLGQILGAISTLLYLLPGVICAIIEYVYFRDVLHAFKPDQKSNVIHSIVVVLLDNLLAFDLARSFYLLTIMKRTPIHKSSTPEDDEPLFPMDDSTEDFM